MLRPSRYLAIKYHGRAIFRACLAEWYGVLDWFAARWPLTQEETPTPPIRVIPPAMRAVACYPASGPVAGGQRLDVRVVIATDKDGIEIVPRSEGVDQYLWKIESSMLPLHRHTP